MSKKTLLHSCVTPEGKFVYGIHKPSYTVANLRKTKELKSLGVHEESTVIYNEKNFPDGELQVAEADWIFEIRNPFTFRGVTFIAKSWADYSANNYDQICIPKKPELSMHAVLKESSLDISFIKKLPEPLLLSLATCSTDPEDLVSLATLSCSFTENDSTLGLLYKQNIEGHLRPEIHSHLLFEAVANNKALPDEYKKAMVIRPGAQGGSEVVGDYCEDNTPLIYEYLRRNSYIGGGHYAANMSDNAIRYSIDDLTKADVKGLRHLYYQRSYIRMAELLQIDISDIPTKVSGDWLEKIRLNVLKALQTQSSPFNATLWGWNFGFDYAPSKYRLHASHQQVHQQYAMLPSIVTTYSGDPHTDLGQTDSYGCGELITKNITEYHRIYKRDFFTDYLTAIRNNKRMDGREDLADSLIIWQDEHVVLFVPKAQTSQWELQAMTCPDKNNYVVGNIIEASSEVRNSLDKSILYAQKALAGLGAQMVTSIEYPKSFDKENNDLLQPLIYCFLPRLPESPGAFSEAQLRYINGHYPEDFAAVCRDSLKGSL